jgi:aminomethyltransferase
MPELKRTPLHELHQDLGARMVPFAGYEMPVQYAAGVMKEHLHCREAAALFDVSHMGQIVLRGAGADAALERLMPSNICGLGEGRQRYGLLTNDEGGIRDDLMVARKGDHLLLVVNAATKEADFAHIRDSLDEVEAEMIEDRALLALQGPGAEAALAAHAPGAADMRFMDVAEAETPYGTLWISRSGYTGEDGFEISVPGDRAADFARALLSDSAVRPAGLGARDSLRLEAGLCLYGTDIDEETTPVEAALTWAVPKVRRTGGDREGGFPGDETILRQLQEGPARRRVGLRPEGRAPMRAGTALFDAPEGGKAIGKVTSGAFGPTVGAPISMGYLPTGLDEPGTQLWGEVRGKRLPVTVAALPFHTTSYKR